jgi:hypothetical protein
MTQVRDATDLRTLSEAWCRRSGSREAPTVDAIRELTELRDAICAIPTRRIRLSPARIEEVRASIAQMSFGPGPDGLHPEVAGVWTESAVSYASESALSELSTALEGVIEPARKAAADLEQQRLALERERELYETFAVLASVLDEFVATDTGEPS